MRKKLKEKTKERKQNKTVNQKNKIRRSKILKKLLSLTLTMRKVIW